MAEMKTERDVVARGFVEGRVQGVWFRETTRRRAVELGLTGFVRNLPDQRVEAEFVGPLAAVELALSFIERGPEHARVDRVEGFEIEELPSENRAQATEFLIL